jgi:hypothetical protein
MHVINCLELQLLLVDGDMFNTQLRTDLIITIRALCAAGPRKVASRADLFQGIYFPYSLRRLYTLACLGEGNGRGFIQ